MQPREPHPIDAILPTLGDIRTIVEIGCHRMEDTAFLRQTFPDARIIAFDPDPRNALLIQAGALAWQHDVDFFQLAIAERDGVADFWVSTNHAASAEREWSRSNSLRRPHALGDVDLLRAGVVPCVFMPEPIKVACMRLDSFFARVGIRFPDFIWCDAQGAEDLIIAGAADTLKRTRWLLLEHNTDGCYVAAPDRAKLQSLLPGWETVHVWPHDMLLRNPMSADGS